MKIEDYKNLWKTKSIEEIFEILSKKMLSINYGTDFCENQTFEGLYRARKHNHVLGNLNDSKLSKFLNEREFWNVPASYVKQLGRCNNIGESMFYSSNEFEVVIMEMKPKRGDFLSVAHFKNLQTEEVGNKYWTFKIKPVGYEFLKGEELGDCVKEIISKNKSVNILLSI